MFLLSFYLSRNYQITKHDGFWFFMALFTAGMTGVMVAGSTYIPILFLIASASLFTATYTL
ncbi:MAG: hypothetical protein D6733_05045 [Methanobacteriota archaeon]|nr:MAG: hypothetical protein D6733_05045 [Euryarchaeota archaeon]